MNNKPNKYRFTAYLLFLLLFVAKTTAWAQQADEELAGQFFQNKEYEKAADMYEKLLNKSPKSIFFYDNLLACYIQQNNFESAQKLAKKQARKFENNPFYRVDQGYILKLQNLEKKSQELYESLIKSVAPFENNYYDLAKAFEKRGEKLFAISTLLAARNALKNELLFASDLGSLYSDLNEIPKMIDEYLLVLATDRSSIEEIQGFFQNKLKNNQEYEILKQSLQKKTKQFPNNFAYPEMLIWLHVQRNEYDLALLYAKSIDKKNNEDGRRLIDLGFLAQSNGKYDAAISIFKQTQLLGKDKPYYTLAKNSETESRAKKIFEGNYALQDLKLLEAEYLNLLDEFGKTPSTATTIKNLANLEAYYLNNSEKAIAYYVEVIQMQRVSRTLQAECKLALGDYYLMLGEVWEAMLLYGQVDKDFLQEPLGQEAKFRNAKLSYYMGEFDWAKAQLDILKTATTQLISNNALELSLVIQDNTIDSIFEPLIMFAQADLFAVQNKDSIALQKLDSILLVYPKCTLIDDVIFKKAEIYSKKKDYTKAISYYQKVLSDYGSGILGDNALYNLARLQQLKLNNPDEALKLYEKFIDTYPGSFFLTDCRKQYRLLRGDVIN